MSKMISPLEAEKKWSNWWLFLDFKPLFVAYVFIFILGVIVLCSGSLKQAHELPTWASPWISVFNAHVSDHLWVGERVDLLGFAYSTAERELLKFLSGISFATLAWYVGFANLHILLYLPRLWPLLFGLSWQIYKVVLSGIMMQALGLWALFDGPMLVRHRLHAGEIAPLLFPLFFNFLFLLFLVISASGFRRVVISYALLNSAAGQPKE